MAEPASAAVLDFRRDWKAALTALKRLMAEPGDTEQVFHIMRALNADTAKTGYERLLRTAQGGRLARAQLELAARLSDPAFIAAFPKGSVGAAYGHFLRRTGYSAQGLAEVSRTDGSLESDHPYAWYGRRMRDVHDIWHVLTGYRADDPLGEASLVAFSYAQSGGLGWAAIALGSAVKALRQPKGGLAVRAIWEGYRLGRRAVWLPGENYEMLLAQPLDAARRRLRLERPSRYYAAEEALAYDPADMVPAWG
jgi:ubiquinone biosynthesis protein COQ4